MTESKNTQNQPAPGAVTVALDLTQTIMVKYREVCVNPDSHEFFDWDAAVTAARAAHAEMGKELADAKAENARARAYARHFCHYAGQGIDCATCTGRECAYHYMMTGETMSAELRAARQGTA